MSQILLLRNSSVLLRGLGGGSQRNFASAAAATATATETATTPAADPAPKAGHRFPQITLPDGSKVDSRELLSKRDRIALGLTKTRKGPARRLMNFLKASEERLTRPQLYQLCSKEFNPDKGFLESRKQLHDVLKWMRNHGWVKPVLQSQEKRANRVWIPIPKQVKEVPPSWAAAPKDVLETLPSKKLLKQFPSTKSKRRRKSLKMKSRLGKEVASEV